MGIEDCYDEVFGKREDTCFFGADESLGPKDRGLKNEPIGAHLDRS